MWNHLSKISAETQLPLTITLNQKRNKNGLSTNKLFTVFQEIYFLYVHVIIFIDVYKTGFSHKNQVYVPMEIECILLIVK